MYTLSFEGKLINAYHIHKLTQLIFLPDYSPDGGKEI